VNRRILSLLICLMLLTLAACSQEKLIQDTQAIEQGIPEENALGVRMIEYRDDKVDYIIEAAAMDRYTDRRMTYGYDVTLTSYDRQDQISAVIKADTTIVDDARNIIFANGNVEFKGREGTLRSQKMIWERTLDEITVPTYVVLIRGDDVLRGNNLRTNAKLSYAEMELVSGEGYVDEKTFSW
jgi:LPS export ABC transporter protein LptC